MIIQLPNMPYNESIIYHSVYSSSKVFRPRQSHISILIQYTYNLCKQGPSIITRPENFGWSNFNIMFLDFLREVLNLISSNLLWWSDKTNLSRNMHNQIVIYAVNVHPQHAFIPFQRNCRRPWKCIGAKFDRDLGRSQY